MHQADLEALATQLAASPEYRVLRRINPRAELAPDTGRALLKGIVVDTETTDLDSSRGKIIEIGIVAFEYDPATGQPIRVIDSYGELEDPGQPLSPEITAITGITDVRRKAPSKCASGIAASPQGTHLCGDKRRGRCKRP